MSASWTAAGRAPASGLSFRLSLFGDERLARLVASGSERAFAVLYERYHQPLYRYCRSIVGEEADAQDALQSTLTSALAALQRGRRDAPLRPWLFRIAHNEAISLIRRRRGDVELTDLPQQAVGSAEDRAGERARLRLLVADLGELTDRQRGALVMRELSGLSHEEIAIALGISVGATKQTIFEARRSLSEFAEGRAMACEEIRRTISDGDGRAMRGRRVRAHLRDCSGCAAFAAAIPARTADLRAAAPPLPAVAAAGLFARAIGAGSGHGGAGVGGLAAASAGKTVSTALVAKVLAGGVILATATVGATALRGTFHTTHRPAATHTAPPPTSGAAASGRSLTSRPFNPGTRTAQPKHGALRAGSRSTLPAGSALAPQLKRNVPGRTVAASRRVAGAHRQSAAHAQSGHSRSAQHTAKGKGRSRRSGLRHRGAPVSHPLTGRRTRKETSSTSSASTPPIGQAPATELGRSSSQAG